jgi:hypothetical protein
MPARSELPTSVVVLPRRVSASDKMIGSIAAMLKNPEFQIAALFSGVGLWLTFVLIQYFPDYAATVASLDLF